MSADGQLIFQDFIRNAPSRHVDVGISEATLIGAASGIARCGRPVVVSAIASFLLRRAYEQIVIDIGFDRLPVTLIGVGGGLAYGPLGPTHHIAEDVALMRLIPGMAVFAPADAVAAADALRLATELPGPSYIRIGSGEDALLAPMAGSAGTAPRMIRDGSDLSIVASGVCVHEAVAAATELAGQGLEARVIDVMCLQPWPADEIAALLLPGRPVIAVEEHVREGGLGTLVQEIPRDRGHGPLARLAVGPRPSPIANRQELLAFHGVDRTAIAGAARRLAGETARSLTLQVGV
jgi:transketolase